MNLLLDSNALIWILGAKGELSDSAKAALENERVTSFYSVASIWELEIKRSKGKLQMADTWQENLAKNHLTELRITAADATASAHLPWHHRDPFDRIIVAQALAHDLTIITRDTFLATYGVKVIGT